MKEFTYTIKDELGIHARPAGMLAKEAKNFKSKITLSKMEGQSSDITKLISLMTLGIKCGNEVTVTAEGEDEDIAIEAIKKLLMEHL